MRVFITGTAGFIGFHLARRLISDGHPVVGFDGMTPYYDIELKRERLAILEATNGYRHHTDMLEDPQALARAGEDCDPEVIIHLAAQAGVRYSLDHPDAYVSSNLVGTFNVMELARQVQPGHLMIASSSSVYGGNRSVPFLETEKADHPISLYAATKKATEAMSHAYAHLWGIPTTAFRFFTVYGPYGRPDMAPIKFLELIEANKPIDIYGNGKMRRDFTYIDDLIEGVVRLMHKAPKLDTPAEGVVTDTLSPVAPWRIVNIGNGKPVELMDFISMLEKALGKTAKKNMLPMQQGDVAETYASNALLTALTGYTPRVGIEEGVMRLVEWQRGRIATQQAE